MSSLATVEAVIRSYATNAAEAADLTARVCTTLAAAGGNVRAMPVVMLLGQAQREGKLRVGILKDFVAAQDAIAAEMGMSAAPAAAPTPQAAAAPPPLPAASQPGPVLPPPAPAAAAAPVLPALPPNQATVATPNQVAVVMPSGRRKRQPRTTAATVTTESGVERPAASQPVRSVSDPASVPVAAPVVQRPVIPAVDPAAAQAAGFSAEMLQSLGPLNGHRAKARGARDLYVQYSLQIPWYSSAEEYRKNAPTAVVPLRLVFRRPLLGVIRYLATDGKFRHTLPELLLMCTQFRMSPTNVKRGLTALLNVSAGDADGSGGWVICGESADGSPHARVGVVIHPSRTILPGDILLG